MLYTNGPVTTAAANTVLATFTPAAARYYRIRVMLSTNGAGSVQPVTLSLPGGTVTFYMPQYVPSAGCSAVYDLGELDLPGSVAVDLKLPNGSGGTVEGSLFLEAGADC